MKKWLSLILALNFFSSFAVAEVSPYPEDMHGVVTAPGAVELVFCRLGSCKAIGSEKGYSHAQWEKIKNICRDEALTGPAYDEILDTIGVIIMTATRLGAFRFAGAAITGEGNDYAPEEAASLRLNGVLSLDLKFQLTSELYVDLKKGIHKCAAEFDQNRQTERLLRACPNPVLCGNMELPPDDDPYDFKENVQAPSA